MFPDGCGRHDRAQEGDLLLAEREVLLQQGTVGPGSMERSQFGEHRDGPTEHDAVHHPQDLDVCRRQVRGVLDRRSRNEAVLEGGASAFVRCLADRGDLGLIRHPRAAGIRVHAIGNRRGCCRSGLRPLSGRPRRSERVVDEQQADGDGHHDGDEEAHPRPSTERRRVRCPRGALDREGCGTLIGFRPAIQGGPAPRTRTPLIAGPVATQADPFAHEFRDPAVMTGQPAPRRRLRSNGPETGVRPV